MRLACVFEIRLVLGYNICYNRGGATLVREVGQGRNPAALSDVRRVLFFYFQIVAFFI